MATHQCSICLKKTIQGETIVNPPLVLATAACPAERGDGIHRWTRIAPQPQDLSFAIPRVDVRDHLLSLRVTAGTSFLDLLDIPLPFKIPIQGRVMINQFPDVFQYAESEYGTSLDTWLEHRLISWTSERAVVILDGMWQTVLKSIANVVIFLDEHDKSSQKRLRPDFAAMFQNCLVIKGKAKATHADMMTSSGDLTAKFHKHAYKLFPKGCNSIPGVTTSNEAVSLYSISFFQNKFSQQHVKDYNVSDFPGRVAFAVDLFKILIWTLSQTEPTEGYHLIPDRRTKTNNGHHVTLMQEGILKEFDQRKLHKIQIDTIGAIYALRLRNVEYGTVNCKSVTITRVGSRLRDALRARHMNKQLISDQIMQGICQLHAIGYAHCDLCVDNIFVDSEEDGGAVFLGDLEYCRGKDDKPPTDIRRADSKAKTAEELDLLQFEQLKDELASI